MPLEPAPWYTVRRAVNAKPTTYRCPFCEERFPALAEHVLVAPLGDTSRRRHAHTSCAMAARRDGRLPLRDEAEPRTPGPLSRLVHRLRGAASAALLLCVLATGLAAAARVPAAQGAGRTTGATGPERPHATERVPGASAGGSGDGDGPWRWGLAGAVAAVAFAGVLASPRLLRAVHPGPPGS